jgi:hydroxyacylglutathione hydrolase
MIIKRLEVGPLMTNCYIVGCEDTKEAAVIDPGDNVNDILFLLAKNKLTLKYILNTHGHFDHTGGNKELKESTNAKLMIHKADEIMIKNLSTLGREFGLSVENSPSADGYLDDNDIISFGNIKLKVLHTPGHSQGGVSFYMEGHAFVGDTLFNGSIGRTDFPGGDYNVLISGVKEKLFVLDDITKVYPGHGPETTIGHEKRYNMFFR